MSEASLGLAVAFAGGVLSFLSPCVLPLVPSYLAFVTGMSVEDLREGTKRRATLVHATLFVLGFSTIFILLGVSASFLGQFLRRYEAWITRLGGLIIVALGMHLVGLLRLAPLLLEKRVHLSDRPAGHIGSFVVGLTFGAGWTPCIGPVLGGILTYGVSQDTMWAGAGLLSVYALGLAVPFFLAAVAVDRFLLATVAFKRWLPLVERVSGSLLIVFGLLLLSGKFTLLAEWLGAFTPATLGRRL